MIIINADDFGLNERCTDAICEAFRRKLITDTTMMANGEAFGCAVKKITTDHLELRVGIHFNLTEGIPVTKDITHCPAFVTNGRFHGKIDRLKLLSKAEKKAVYQELTAQVNRMKKCGVYISHADSHHHIHTAIFIAPIVARVCRENGIQKVRLHRNIGNISKFKRIVKNGYNAWLRSSGFTTTDYFGSLEDVQNVGLFDRLEIMVHPDFDKSGRLIDRINEIDGVAVGEELIIPDDGEMQLISYEEL